MAAKGRCERRMYNDDPVLQDARLCRNNGIPCAVWKLQDLQAKDPARIERAIQKNPMLNAYLFIQSGIPVIYSGDGIGQLNDYSIRIIRMQTVRQFPLCTQRTFPLGAGKEKEQKRALSEPYF